MRKFICGILVTIIMMCSTTPVAAIETCWGQQVQISYTYEGNYMIYIPMEANVGDNISVMADEINILDNKKIKVSVGNFDYDSRIVLQNANSESTLYAIIKDTNGNQITMDNNVIGEFDNTERTSKSIYTEVYYDSMAKAGTYTGYIDFYVEVIEK